MTIYSDYNEALADLSACGDLLMRFMRIGVVHEVRFGFSDLTGGYGWHVVMAVTLNYVCRKCTRPGCYYDERKPEAVLREEER